ncbi:hypothetical protein ACFLYP_01340 [Chloroflexota bacterium]
MKLFGKRNNVRRELDKIWKTRQLEYAGLVSFIESLDEHRTRVLVIAHFPATLRALSDLLTAKTVAFNSYLTSSEGIRLRELSEYQFPGQILLAVAHALPYKLPSRPKPNISCDFEINLLVAEHHPLPSFDDRISEFAASLPCPSRVCFHDALDGALLSHFGGAQMAQLMTTLRTPDSEFISNSKIDRSIRRAQKKIARRVTNPMTADSAEQWFQMHLPNRE